LFNAIEINSNVLFNFDPLLSEKEITQQMMAVNEEVFLVSGFSRI